jgi:hypothetical protein
MLNFCTGNLIILQLQDSRWLVLGLEWARQITHAKSKLKTLAYLVVCLNEQY